MDLILDGIKCVAIEVLLHHKQVFIITCYRPPGQTQPEIDIFLNSLQDLLNVIFIESPESVFLVGDFNDRCQTWEDSHSQSELKTKLYDLVKNNNFEQVIHEATYFSENSCSLLDLIITDSPAYIVNLYVGSPLGDPNHCATFCSIRIQYNKDKPYSREIWDYNACNYAHLNNALETAPWNTLEMFDNIDDVANQFVDLYSKIFKEFILCKIIKISPQDKPWLNRNVKQLFKKRDKLQKKWKMSQNLQDYENFRQLRCQAKTEKSLSKQKYYGNIEKN